MSPAPPANDNVVTYRRKALRIGEVWFDAAAESAGTLPALDILRVVGILSPTSEEGWHQRHTLLIDLTLDEDQLFQQMTKKTRYEVRRAIDEGAVRIRTEREPDAGAIDEFVDYFDRFAAARSLAPASRPRLDALARQGQLVLTSAADELGDVLVRHVYVAARGRSQLLYSGSAPQSQGVDGQRIGRANRYLHWRDICLFRELGYEQYDFGGLDVSGRSEKTTQIAAFKRGFGGVVMPVYGRTRPCSLRGATVLRLLALRGADF